MNVAILDVHPTEPSARALMERALDPHILLGMPHLTPSGLSETWLMKELGHRHWLMLAKQLGMDSADFRMSDGGEAYAAICATSLRHARFQHVRANQVLTILSTFAPVSRTLSSTHHRLSIGGELIGEIELLSTFVHRRVNDDNHSIARVEIPLHGADRFRYNELAITAAELRCGSLQVHLGMAADSEVILHQFVFTPSTLQEFNGAGLLYFANFQALVDRAVETWFPKEVKLLAAVHRDVFFSGNARCGETLSIELAAFNISRCETYCRIRREDGHIIARSFMAGCNA
jgi:probable biosynthetic protein (TIGR04099 family)